ncbi:hypothetical protein HQ590_07810 [bacterium]|nr:hypothetical protein [bacterium]
MPAASPVPPRFRISLFQWIVRVVGGLLLTAAAVMLVLGLTLLADELYGVQFAVYWSRCFLITVAAILVALLDFYLLRRAYQRTRRELFRRQFMSGDLAARKEQRDQSP